MPLRIELDVKDFLISDVSFIIGLFFLTGLSMQQVDATDEVVKSVILTVGGIAFFIFVAPVFAILLFHITGRTVKDGITRAMAGTTLAGTALLLVLLYFIYLRSYGPMANEISHILIGK